MSADMPLKEVSAEKTPLCAATSVSLDPQQDLLDSIVSGRWNIFCQLVQRDDVKLGYIYPRPHNTSCLVAASVSGRLDYLAALLKYGADANIFIPSRKTTPLHVAVKDFNAEAVLLLLSHGAAVDMKNERGRTALHVLASQTPETSRQVAQTERMVVALLSHAAVDVDGRDASGLSALQLAVLWSADTVARHLLSNGADPRQPAGDEQLQSAGQLLEARGVRAEPALWVTQCVAGQGSASNRLYETLVERDLVAFREVLEQADTEALNASHDSVTCLQYACDRGLADFVDALLQAGASVQVANAHSGQTALHLAAARGFRRILSRLISHQQQQHGAELLTELVNAADLGGQTLLHKLVRPAETSADSDAAELADHSGCLQDLADSAERLCLEVNATDNLDCTALHHAVKSGNAASMQLLLRMGSNIGLKNIYAERPVSGLPPDILQEYLDECVSTNGKYVNDREFRIGLCYSFLTPRRSATDDKERVPLPEADSLWYMSQSKRHRHLLKHPVISSFLHLKWQKIRRFFAINMLFYTVFVAMMTAFIFISIDGEASLSGRVRRQAGNSTGHGEAKTAADTVGAQLVFYTSAATVVVLLIRELFQFLVAPRRYIFFFENILELSLLGMSFFLLFFDMDRQVRVNLSSMVVLLSWAEFFMLMGRLPLFSIYVTMFSTVLFRFLKFLAWYSVLIVAFALSMYILFRGDESFPDLSSSLIKTMVMAVGEMDYGSMPIQSSTPIAQLVFIAFLFLISIVLMNLLNGLAVADTGEIELEAQIYGYVGRVVELISYVESMLLGDPFQFLSNYPPFKWLQLVPDCAPLRCLNNLGSMTRLRVWCGHHSLLFFNALPSKTLGVFPNQEGMVDPETCLEHFSLDNQIIEDACAVVTRQRGAANGVSQRLRTLEQKMDRLLNAVLATR